MTRWNLLSLLVVASSVIPAFATVPVYGQCGGKEWTGETGEGSFIIYIDRLLMSIV